MNIFLYDSTVKYDQKTKVNDLIILLGPLTEIIQSPYINISQTIRSSCKKTYIENNEITVIYNDFTNYKKYILPINSKFKLSIIYIKIANQHLFITYYIHLNCKLLFKLQTDLLYNVIEEHHIPYTDYIIISGNFGYNFYENPGEISSLCDKIFCNIPRIFTDDKSILDKFIFIKKTNKTMTTNIHYKEDVCKYTFTKRSNV